MENDIILDESVVNDHDDCYDYDDEIDNENYNCDEYIID